MLLTGAFGLRMGEAVALKAEDVDIQAEIPKLRVTGDTVGNRKSPGDVNLTESPASLRGMRERERERAIQLGRCA